MNTNTFEYPLDEGLVLIGDESWESIKNTFKLLWAKFRQDEQEIIKLYNWFISQRFSPAQVDMLFKNITLETHMKDNLIRFINMHTKVLEIIRTEVGKLKKDNRYRTKNINEESPIFKQVVNILKQNNALYGLVKDSGNSLINPYWKSYKEPMKEDTLYNLGYRSLNDINNIVIVSKKALKEINNVIASMSYTNTYVVEDTIVIEKNTSALFELSMDILKVLAWDFNELNKIFKYLSKAKAMESLFSLGNFDSRALDPGIEFLGFGGPKDGDVAADVVFGRMRYYEKYKLWYCPEAYIPDSIYTTYNNKNIWESVWVEPKYKNFYKVANFVLSGLNNKNSFKKLFELVGYRINSVEEYEGTFNATCDLDQLAAGKDKRFCWITLSFIYFDSLKTNVGFFTLSFNRRIFYMLVTGEGKLYIHVPKSPTIMSNVVSVKDITFDAINNLNNQKDIINQLINAQESLLPSLNITFEGELSSIIENNSDPESTEVNVNSQESDPDSTSADVDIKIDLTPDREQKLLKSLTYDCKYEIDVYGIEGLIFKINQNYKSLSDLFVKLYDEASIANKLLVHTSSDNISFVLDKYMTDIANKEYFIEEISDASKKVALAFSNLKKLNKDTVGKLIVDKTNVHTYTSIESFVISSNFTSKDDIQFIGCEIYKTKANVNMSQIKFYTNEICNMLKTNQFSTDEYKNIDDVLTEMNASLLNLANIICQSNRFISGISLYANS